MYKWFWNRVMDGSGKNFETCIGKCLCIMEEITFRNTDAKGNYDEGLEGNKEDIERASIFLENTYIIIYTMLLELSMLKMFLVGSQEEINAMLLDTGGKCFIIKWQDTLLNYVLVLGTK